MGPGGRSGTTVVPVGEDGEPLDERTYRLQSMLPWNLEAQIGAALSIIKLPFIFFVAIVGLKAENHLKYMTKESFLRYGHGSVLDGVWALLMNSKTGCYAHILHERLPSHNLINFGLEDPGGFGNSTFDPLNMGNPDTCEINKHSCKVRGLPHPGFFTGGIDHMVSFALLWFVYKLVFIGIHPIDRAQLILKGNPGPGPDYPEPLMKLLTEPYFQKCTFPMQVLVKFLFYFRYKMMPNALLGALASMHDMAPQCPHVVYYKFSPAYGNLCYFMCLLDLIALFGFYGYAKLKMEGKLIGKNRYRGWKTGWLISALLWAFVAVWASFRTFGGLMSVIKAMFASFFTLVFRLSLTFKMNLDMLRVLTFAIFFFEGLELFSFLAVIILPKVAPNFWEKVQKYIGPQEPPQGPSESSPEGYRPVEKGPAK